jgi:glycosyltransferase involved in cell wall biosynthesis
MKDRFAFFKGNCMALRVQVLLPTLKTSEKSLFDLCKTLRVSSDALIVSQGPEATSFSFNFQGHQIQVIGTSQKGVSAARNALIEQCYGDVGLFIDDDCVLAPDYEKTIAQAFQEIPSADLIRFNTIRKERNPVQASASKKKRARYRDISSFGVWGLAFKTKSLRDSPIRFDEDLAAPNFLFNGEDSLFLKQLVRGFHEFYLYPANICEVVDDGSSTWFSGFDRRYFITKGYVYKKLYGSLWRLALLRVFQKYHQDIPSSYFAMKPFARFGASLAAHQKTVKWPLRILVVGMSQNPGGTEAVLMNTYRHLDRTKIQFDFLNVYDGDIAFSDEILSLGGRILSLKLKRRNGLMSYYKGIKRFFAEHRGEFFGIHMNILDPVNLDLLRYGKKYGIPLRILHAHNGGYGARPSRLSRLAIFVNKLKMFSYVTDFVACSKEAADFCFGKNAKQAEIIPNGIDVDKFLFSEKERLQVRSDLSLTNELTFGTIGRLDPQKNHLFLLSVFAQVVQSIPSAKLVIEGKGCLANETKEAVNRLGLNQNVLILENTVSPAKLYNAFDVFLLPSLFEGFPVTLIEAQANNLPCLASEKVTHSAVCSDRIGFLPLDQDVWVKALLKCSALATRSSLSTAAQEQVFSAQQMADSLSKIYRGENRGK